MPGLYRREEPGDRARRSAGAVVRLARQRAGFACRIQRGGGARRRGPARLGAEALDDACYGRASPHARVVLHRLPRAARADRDPGPVRHDRLGGGGGAVRVPVPDARDWPGRPGGRLRRCRADHQPGPAATGLPRLARGALAGLPGLAGCVRARGHRRHRLADLVGGADRMGLCGGGRDRHRGPPAGQGARSGHRTVGHARTGRKDPLTMPSAGSSGHAPLDGLRRPGTLPRLLPGHPAAGPVGLAGHLARYGPSPSALGRQRRRELIAEVGRAGLTGRGGAGFPAAGKLAAVAAGRAPVVIANGTEGEPASAKDKVLMARSPHLVIDGAVLAAELVGGRETMLVVHRRVREIMDEAAAERRRAHLDRVKVTIRTAADRFAGGEASAVVHWIERGVPTPTAKPPRLSERGLGGRPTLVHNVETLAHLALIARHGAPWFRSVGTSAEPGSMLVTVLGAVREPCVLEIAIGTPVGQVLGLAGGPSVPLQALLLGGYFGGWVKAADAADRPFSSAGLADLDAGTGAGLIAALPADAGGIAETARLVRYLAAESAGQCGPCLFGLAAIAAELTRIAEGRTTELGLLRRWLGQVDGRGGCAHPDGAVRLVRSALRVFGDW